MTGLEEWQHKINYCENILRLVSLGKEIIDRSKLIVYIHNFLTFHFNLK